MKSINPLLCHTILLYWRVSEYYNIGAPCTNILLFTEDVFYELPVKKCKVSHNLDSSFVVDCKFFDSLSCYGQKTSQAATCPSHTRRRLHTVPLFAKRQVGKL